MDLAWERSVRDKAMEWLDARRASVDLTFMRSSDLRSFEIDGAPMSLVDQRGIRKPASMAAALTIRTTFTKAGDDPPYADEVGTDGLARYKYKGTDPEDPDNRALRAAMHEHLPLIWFVGVDKGRYVPIYPVWVIGEEPERHQFILATDENQEHMIPGTMSEDVRRYAQRLTKQRLHQPVFRSQVLLAYESKCAICRIRHTELLDAAHIIEDGKPHGQAIVPNGISLCKIHHAAFDANIVGIRPDLTLHVRDDVMDEVDGWMLKGGIQGVHNRRLDVVPAKKSLRPDPDRLDERYSVFLNR